MFFVTSKIFWWLLAPLQALILLQTIGLFCLWSNRPRLGRWLIAASTAAMVGVTFLPVPEMVLRPLEQWIPPPSRLPDEIDGIVLLGGAQEAALTEAYGKATLNAGADTMTSFVALARRFPHAKLIFAGGSGELSPGATTEADVVRLFFREQGVDPSRLIVENQSRNTHENAVFAREIAKPKPGETWLLIAQAYHMPRAIGVFRKLGWDVIPYPVAYRVLPTGWQIFPYAVRQFGKLDSALHEWIGLAIYRLTDRI